MYVCIYIYIYIYIYIHTRINTHARARAQEWGKGEDDRAQPTEGRPKPPSMHTGIGEGGLELPAFLKRWGAPGGGGGGEGARRGRLV